MDRVQQLAQIVETQQMQIEYWKGVTVALSLVVRAECEKLSPEEVEELLRDLHAHGVSMVTVGQYLPPSGSHLPLERFVTPAEFEHYREYGRSLGIRQVASAPLVRSSFHAEEQAGQIVFVS